VRSTPQPKISYKPHSYARRSGLPGTGQRFSQSRQTAWPLQHDGIPRGAETMYDRKVLRGRWRASLATRSAGTPKWRLLDFPTEPELNHTAEGSVHLGKTARSDDEVCGQGQLQDRRTVLFPYDSGSTAVPKGERSEADYFVVKGW